MSETDKRIKAAAAELGAAPSEGGKDYWDVTRLESAPREFVYPVWGESSGLNRIADEIGRLADATYMLARATAGEFDEPDEAIDPDATRLPDGYRGMR